MIPNTAGTALWADKTGWLGRPKGAVYSVDVVDVGDGAGGPWLRVYWKGGYYNVTPDDFSSEGECWPKEGWL